jgi:hypothetical protein
MSTGPRGGRGARRGPARSGHWLTPLGRNTWYLAIVAVAVLGLTAGGVALLASSGGGPSREAAPDCGLINCSANLPGPSTTISTQSHVGKAHTAVSHRPAAPARPAPHGSSAPSQGSAPGASTPAAPAPANVSVAFSSDRDRRDFDHFQAQMTLVNNGGSAVSGWTVQLTLPVDGVDSVDNQNGRDGAPFEHWQFSGDTLTITADTDSETLGPGAPMNMSIHGRGNAAYPTRCTFNGASCPLVQQDQQPGQPSQFAGPDQQASQFGGPDQQPSPQSAEPGQQGQWSGQQDRRSRPGGGTGQPHR